MAVDLMANGDEFKGSPFFCMGIRDLTVPHEPVPPVAEWTEERRLPEDPTRSAFFFAFPAKSVVILDEAQTIFRPRSASSKVPPEVQAFETCRHTGVRFVLITQDAALLDANVRRLVGRHIHIKVTPFGRYKYEWTGVGDPESKSSRDQSARSKYKPPKRVFNLYKSAEVHTKTKVRLPLYAYVLFISLAIAIGCGVYIYRTISAKMSPEKKTDNMALVVDGRRPPSAQNAGAPVSPAEYAAHYSPRIEGLPHSAPAYDKVTEPVIAPEPIGCMDSKRSGCKCFTQQGTRYETTADICRQILAGGLWMPWKAPEKAREVDKAPAVLPAEEKTNGGPSALILPASVRASDSEAKRRT